MWGPGKTPADTDAHPMQPVSSRGGRGGSASGRTCGGSFYRAPRTSQRSLSCRDAAYMTSEQLDRRSPIPWPHPSAAARLSVGPTQGTGLQQGPRHTALALTDYMPRQVRHTCAHTHTCTIKPLCYQPMSERTLEPRTEDKEVGESVGITRDTDTER